MPHKRKCAGCEHSLCEWLMEVRGLSCGHYYHSKCMVALLKEAEEMEDEDNGTGQAYCYKCGCKISEDWLKKTVDEIEEQQRIEQGVDYKEFYSEFSLRAMDTISGQFNQLQRGICRHSMNRAHSDNCRNFVEYMSMLQKVLTLVQQLEDNDRKGEKNN